MGGQLHIHEFKTRYRLSARTRDSRSRLDRILQQVMDKALDSALSELGIAANEELCIRELKSLVHLRLQDPDQHLAELWSKALVSAIEQALAQEDSEGSRQVVRYRSRMHGLIDFATGVAYQRLQRAWAWRQLGFIESEVGLSHVQAVDQLLGCLVNDAQLIVPLVEQMAGEGRLIALAKQFSPRHWQQLSQSVAAVSIASDVAEAPSVVTKDSILEADLMRMAETQWRRSRIAAAVIAHPQVFIERQAPLASIAVLVSAEIEPALFLRPRAWLTQWLTILGRQLVSMQPSLERLAGDWLGVASVTTMPTLDGSTAGHVDSLNTNVQGHNGQDEFRLSSVPESGSSTSMDRAAVETNSVFDDLADSQHDELLPLPESVWLASEWGGVFFLYNIIDELDLPRRLMRETLFMNRPLGWCLQALLESLLPQLEGEDVVALFAGADADAPPPWAMETVLTEQHILAGYVLEISHRLQQRLQWPDETTAMLDWVCRRPAQLRLEPGWLTVLLPLTEIDTEIRRSALDLNPGYLPWLGRVVEFVYE